MNEYIHRLYSDLFTTCMQFGMSDVMARDFAKAMVDKIKNNHAGPVYIPQPDKQQRNERTRRMFNDVNHDIVCEEFRISKATLYRVVGQYKGCKAD